LDKGILILYLNGIVELDDYMIQQQDNMLSKEYHLLHQLKMYIKQHNMLKYEKIINDYNKIFPLCQWKINLLNEIKNRI